MQAADSAFATAVDPGDITIKKLFITPLAEVVHPQADTLNPALKAVIEARMQADQSGSQRSNEGGWQSTADFASWAGEPGQALLQFATALATQLTAQHSNERGLFEPEFAWQYNAWANVNEAGASNALHGHAGAYWSAVYWVDDGGRSDDPSVGGDLEFPDPRGMIASVYNPALRMRIEGCVAAGYSTTVAARSGTLIMFPSWLMHSVRRFDGKRPRISIAFNFGVANL
ncbi:TIGR02466 family protein [Pseudomonas sp. HR96]|uniref:TIGR02466 family protein n=1 Tax=Pseudomonas sp. HR96 TaxID=1027966 RepID=UPI002A7667DA|nr:TIGR02466 family protein [Pseudomonas sp. HR96]WPP00639.1 TIGR02466 family protein [Pseudomonas sp. HR96]